MGAVRTDHFKDKRKMPFSLHLNQSAVEQVGAYVKYTDMPETFRKIH